MNEKRKLINKERKLWKNGGDKKLMKKRKKRLQSEVDMKGNSKLEKEKKKNELQEIRKNKPNGGI